MFAIFIVFICVLYTVCILFTSYISSMSQKSDLPSLLPQLDSNHAELQSVCHRGLLFVLGGFYGPKMECVYSDDVFVLSEDGLKWESRQPMLIPRFGFAVAPYNDKLIVSGGYGGRNQRRRHQTCESYNIAEDKWEYFASMQQSRSNHCMIVANESLYVLGGKSYASQKQPSHLGWHPGGARIVSNWVELYDDSSVEWQRKTQMSKARCNFHTIVM